MAANIPALRAIVGDEPTDEQLRALLRDNHTVEAAANRFFDGALSAPIAPNPGKRAHALPGPAEKKPRSDAGSSTAPAPSAAAPSATAPSPSSSPPDGPLLLTLPGGLLCTVLQFVLVVQLWRTRSLLYG